MAAIEKIRQRPREAAAAAAEENPVTNSASSESESSSFCTLRKEREEEEESEENPSLSEMEGPPSSVGQARRLLTLCSTAADAARRKVALGNLMQMEITQLLADKLIVPSPSGKGQKRLADVCLDLIGYYRNKTTWANEINTHMILEFTSWYVLSTDYTYILVDISNFINRSCLDKCSDEVRGYMSQASELLLAVYLFCDPDVARDYIAPELAVKLTEEAFGIGVEGRLFASFAANAEPPEKTVASFESCCLGGERLCDSSPLRAMVGRSESFRGVATLRFDGPLGACSLAAHWRLQQRFHGTLGRMRVRTVPGSEMRPARVIVKELYPSCHAFIYLSSSKKEVSDDVKKMSAELFRDTDFDAPATERLLSGTYVTVPCEAVNEAEEEEDGLGLVGGDAPTGFLRGVVVSCTSDQRAKVYLLDVGIAVKVVADRLRPMPSTLAEREPLIKFVRVQDLSGSGSILFKYAAKVLTRVVDGDSIVPLLATGRFQPTVMFMFDSMSMHPQLAAVR